MSVGKEEATITLLFNLKKGERDEKRRAKKKKKNGGKVSNVYFEQHPKHPGQQGQGQGQGRGLQEYRQAYRCFAGIPSLQKSGPGYLRC